MRISWLTGRAAALTATVMGCLALLVSGCGSSSHTTAVNAGATHGSGASSGASTGAAAVATHAKNDLARYLGVVQTFRAPGPPVHARDLLRGKTVYYVPIFLEAGFFTVESHVLQGIMSRLGAHLVSCNAADSPTTAAGCIDQAVSSRAAGIITDAIPLSFVQHAFANAVEHKIPTVAGEELQPAPDTPAYRKYFTRVSYGSVEAGRLAAESIISTAGEHANLLFANDTTTPLTKALGAGISGELKNCAGCTVKTMTFQDTELQNVPSQVQSALVKDADAQYVVTQYDDPSGSPVLQGASQAKPGIKFATGGADLAGLERVAQGKEVATVAADPVSAEWNDVDALLREVAGMPAVTDHYKVILRVLTKQNISTIGKIDNQGYSTGSWFARPNLYEQAYTKLWGLS